MAGAIFLDVVMAMVAVVVRQRYAHGTSDRGAMLAVTRDAILRIQSLDAICVARIGEFRHRMRVVGEFQRSAVAFDAGVLQDIRAAEHAGVAGIACEFDLVVTVSRSPDRKSVV